MRPEYTLEQIERFWSYIDRSGGPDACWLWEASLDGHGYGQFGISISNRLNNQRAHRVAFFLTYGYWPEPNGCHTCDNPPCCNPGHIFAGTQADNMADAARKGRTARPSHTNPERMPRGDNHWSHRIPDRISRGETHAHAKLTDSQVAEIRRRYAEGDITQGELAREFGIHQVHVSRLILGKRRS